MKTLSRKARPIFQRVLLKVKRFDVNNSIILMSETRSGSTWLMEILSRHPRTIINWEPFHTPKGVDISEYKRRLNKDEGYQLSDNDLRRMYKGILTLRIYTKWTTSHLDLSRLIRAQNVLTKIVRQTNALPWLLEQFEFRYKPIYLLRHPIPTILSQQLHFEDMRAIEMAQQIPQLVLSSETLDYLKSLQSQLENRLALWCLRVQQHLVPQSDNWVIVYYENLVRNPIEEVNRINSECGLNVPINNIDFSKPSKSDFKKQFVQGDAEKQLSKWIDVISTSEKVRFQEILDYFNVTSYSAYDIYPLTGVKVNHSNEMS